MTGYDKDFKRDAIRQMKESGKTQKEMAQLLGVSEASIYKWKKEVSKQGKEAFEETAEQAELKRLRKRNKELELERDILKKAVAIFSKPPNGSTNS